MQAASQIRAAFLIGGSDECTASSRRSARLLRPDRMVVSTPAGDGGRSKADVTPEQRMQARFPQPVRVGDLIGLPLLDDSAAPSATSAKSCARRRIKIELIIGYGGFLGWGMRPVAVPIEVVGIRGPANLPRSICRRSEYAARRPGCRLRRTRARSSPTSDDQDRAVATLILRGECELQSYDHDLVRPITFLCLPTCRQ